MLETGLYFKHYKREIQEENWLLIIFFLFKSKSMIVYSNYLKSFLVSLIFVEIKICGCDRNDLVLMVRWWSWCWVAWDCVEHWSEQSAQLWCDQYHVRATHPAPAQPPIFSCFSTCLSQLCNEISAKLIQLFPNIFSTPNTDIKLLTVHSVASVHRIVILHEK